MKDFLPQTRTGLMADLVECRKSDLASVGVVMINLSDVR